MKKIPVRALTFLALGAALIYGFLAVCMAAFYARRVVTKPGIRSFEVEVLGVDEISGRITLSRTTETVLPGRYSLIRYGAASICNVGEVIAIDGASVTRALLETQFSQAALPRVGEYVRFSGWLYLEPDDMPLEQLGLTVREIDLQSDHWRLPAWEFQSAKPHAEDETWVIHVHGRAASRAEVLRGVEALNDIGCSHLVISYRNDPEALHHGKDLERYTLGALESRDVEVAMKFALNHGATQLLLYGWSMGGSAVLQAAAESDVSTHICGIILDSPAIDWRQILIHQGRLAGLPRHLASLAIGMLNHGVVKTNAGKRFNMNRMNALQLLKRVTAPVLILHSADDEFVPFEPAAAVAKEYPENITLVTFNDAAHVKLYNYDPEKYLKAIRAWLSLDVPGL